MRIRKLTTLVKKVRMDKRGEMSIDLIINMMLVMFLIYTVLQLAPLFTMNMHMAQASETLARTVELTGRVNSPEYNTQLARYEADIGFPFTIAIEPEDPANGWFDQAQGKLAFRAQFTLTMRAEHRINIINPTLTVVPGAGITVPLVKRIYGTSEIYWKE